MKTKNDGLCVKCRLLMVACAVSMIAPVQGKPRAGTPEHELAIQEGVLDGVSRRLERKKEELEVYRKYQEVASNVAKASSDLEALRAEIAELKERKIVAGDEVSAVQLAFEDYRDEYRKSERLAAEGEILDLSETKGAAYTECKVLGISPLHLRVSRPSGTEGIPFQDLPESIQDRFQFGAEEAARYAGQMAKTDAARAKAYSQWKSGVKKEAVQELKGGKLEDQLAQAQQLAGKARQEQEQLRKVSDEWREKASRYWKSMSAARSDSSRKGRERLASKAEGKADEFFELSKAARMEASRLEGIIIELKRQISQEEK